MFLTFLFAYPLTNTLLWSVLGHPFTLENYTRLFGTGLYFRVLANTFIMAATVTVVTALLGYPVAYLLTTVTGRTRKVLLLLVFLPFWTSVLVRSYGWLVLLQRRGIINDVLITLRILDTPLEFVYNRLGVTVALVHFLLPFMILPLYSSMSAIDKNLGKAARSLGAGPYQEFVKIFFPLSLPGLASGSLLAFIVALGAYVTPALLGGPGDTTISMLIEQQVHLSFWGFASALATVLLILTAVVLILYNRLLGLDRMFAA